MLKRSATVFDVLMANASKKKRSQQQCQQIPQQVQISVGVEKKKANFDPGNSGYWGNQSKIIPFTSQQVKISVTELKKVAVDFDPEKAGYWGKGEKVPFMFVAKMFDVMSGEPSRNVMTQIVCNMLWTVINTTPEDLVAVVNLLDNRIAPPHEGLQLGIGEASIIKAMAETFGAREEHIRKQNKELGDLGLVAKASRSSQRLLRKPEALTVTKVFDTFRIIAKASGKDSQEMKKNHIKSLLVAATDCEPQYLICLLQGKLRIGFAEGTLLAALGHAAFYAQKHFLLPKDVASPLNEAAKILKQVYSLVPVYEKILPALLADGVWDLPKTCTFSVGVPVAPMLAYPRTSVRAVLDQLQDTEFTCEYKYDGDRAQIHFLENGSVEIYSRKPERCTGKYPDVVEAISRLKESNVTSFVLDCELVAYDRENKRIRPFQELRSRIHKDVVLKEIAVSVCIYAFDILYLNGQTVLKEQLDLRRQLLYKSFKEEPGFFQFVTAITSNDPEVINNFLEASIDARCEGLMIKTLKKDATYEPTKRSRNWLKLKYDYLDSVGDTLDLVPIAAFYGSGQRKGVYGSFLLACYDEENEEFQSICKIGTGFNDAMLKELFTRFQPKVIPKPMSFYQCSDNIKPDVWLEPSEVWEVKVAGLTISPVYRAAIGIVHSDKGISLRFPRFECVREVDKDPKDATSSEMVAEMYRSQKHVQYNADEDEDDVKDKDE